MTYDPADGLGILLLVLPGHVARGSAGPEVPIWLHSQPWWLVLGVGGAPALLRPGVRLEQRP